MKKFIIIIKIFFVYLFLISGGLSKESNYLKKGIEHFQKKEFDKSKILFEKDIVFDPKSEKSYLYLAKIFSEKNNNVQQEDQTTLLVIDDNAELRHFISLRLSANYRILQAQDGEQGFDVACNELPDLIISDVAMPKLTGYELTAKLKSTAATKSIPVILLTAKASKREIVEGFTSGADDYLSKPFDTSELIMRVNAQINSRKIIREIIVFEQQLAAEQSEVETSTVRNSTVESSTVRNSIDESKPKKTNFIENINKQVLAHLSDPEFSVETLATLLFMSKATLSRKSKDELTISPRAFIIQTRMQHASKLLQEGTLSVSEIAYAVGFESLSYFSKSLPTNCRLLENYKSVARRVPI